MENLKILSEENQAKIKESAEVLIEVLRNSGDPYMRIVVDQNSARLVVDEACIVSKEPID